MLFNVKRVVFRIPPTHAVPFLTPPPPPPTVPPNKNKHINVHQKSGIPAIPPPSPRKKTQTNKTQKQTNCTLHLNICVFFLPVTCAIVSTCNGVQIGNERWKNPCGTQVELISNIISNIGNGIQLVNQTIQKYVSNNM